VNKSLCECNIWLKIPYFTISNFTFQRNINYDNNFPILRNSFNTNLQTNLDFLSTIICHMKIIMNRKFYIFFIITNETEKIVNKKMIKKIVMVLYELSKKMLIHLIIQVQSTLTNTHTHALINKVKINNLFHMNENPLILSCIRCFKNRWTQRNLTFCG
jgi:hypothetical protein